MKKFIVGKVAKLLASKNWYNYENIVFDQNLNNDIIFDVAIPSMTVNNLIEKGLIEKDIFFGDNLLKLEDYELYNWYYKIEFKAKKGNKTKIIFNGVDTIATYYLNGQKIGYSENMLVEHEFDVSDVLKSSEEESNILIVAIESPILYSARQKAYPAMVSFNHNYSSLLIRQAPHMYGWDIIARAVTSGIWKKIELVYEEENDIKNFYFETLSASAESAWIWFYYETELVPEYFKKAKIRISGQCGDSKFCFEEKMYFKTGCTRFMVDKPKLWWPQGYGEANLYNIKIEILLAGDVLSQISGVVGIRKTIVERDDIISQNSKFQFIHNGVRIMIRGTNHVPLNCFHVDDNKRLTLAMDLIQQANCNLVRCWGGNVYESDEFFEECDRRGLLVWQDMALACNLYPEDERMDTLLRDETHKLAKRIRNHPSLVLYCGDNECDYGYNQFNLNPNNNKLTREVIPSVLFMEDPFKHYMPSSPFYSEKLFAEKNTSLLPEEHLWGPRDYFKSDYYANSKCHFASEIGYHGCPSVDSIKKFIPKNSLWDYKNDFWTLHCTCPSEPCGGFSYRNQLMADQIKVMFGDYVNNLIDFSLCSQISQAEADKFFVETFRSQKWQKSGIIWWNMLDGWPQFSDSVVDYYGEKKLAYYYLQTSQSPIQIMALEPKDWQQKIMILNDTLNDIEGTFIVENENNQKLAGGAFCCEKNENKVVTCLAFNPSQRGLLLLKLIFSDGREVANHYLQGFVPHDFNIYKKYLVKIAEWCKNFNIKSFGV